MRRGDRASAPVTSRPRQRIRPDFTGRIPASASSSSDCPFPATPATPTISPRRTSKRTPLTRSTPSPSSTTRSATSRITSPGRAGPLSTRRLTRRPTISSASCSDVVSAVAQGRDDPALAHDGDGVRHLADLAELVGDEDDRLALAPEGPQDAEEMVGLLRREDRRGLVEDQEVGAPVERLQDLHPLALAHAEVLDPRVEVDLEVVLPAEPLELGPAARQARLEPEAPFDAQDDVLQDGEGLHQHEVLVHHADPGRERVLRAPDRGRPAAHEDLAPVGPMIAVEDAHQRGLAGAVLADDAVDRAGPDRQADVLVGVDLAEPLVDAAELDDGGRGHGASDVSGSVWHYRPITWSARRSTDAGMVSPSALAVSRLTVSSNRTGSTTGRSAGLAPLRILST